MSNGTPASSQIIWLEGEILRLRAENEKLRAALQPFAENRAYVMNGSDMREAYLAAAAALKETGDE